MAEVLNKKNKEYEFQQEEREAIRPENLLVSFSGCR
jgi:hypothetical protein